MLNSALTAQSLGILAWIMGLVAASQKQDTRLKSIYAAMCLVLCAHYTLMGAIVAAGSVFVTGIRNVVSIYSRSKYLSGLFLAAYLTIGYLTYKRPIDILGTSAVCLSTIAFFHLSGLKLRLLMLATCSLWLIHNAAIHSIGGTLLELGNVTLFSWRALKMRRKAV